MKKTLLYLVMSLACVPVFAQLSVKYDSAIQPAGNMQYFRPNGNNLFVGDCIPFYHNGTYFLYWLIDSAHHSALNGLGGHQWVLSTTTDFKQWQHHPVVIGIDEDWEKSICTGSVVFKDDKFYAFYATRLIHDGKVNEQLSYAVSGDGIHFKKQLPNPFYTAAAGYSQRDFRDPKVTVDKAGNFHLFVSSKKDNAAIDGKNGCLVHMMSKDLKTWELLPPVLTDQPSVPECPDYFEWNSWYYLVYSDNSNTYYVKSKKPYGPWEQPGFQALNEDWSNVVKIAPFKNGRCIAAGWVPSRAHDKDSEGEIFGGNVVFRELTQDADGTLATKFPAEAVPATSSEIKLDLITDSTATALPGRGFKITSFNGMATAHMEGLPQDCRIVAEIFPEGLNESFGFYLRSGPKAVGGYNLSFLSGESRVSLGDSFINGVSGLSKPVKIDIVMKNDIIDVCMNGRRCIVNRTIEEKGSYCWFYVKHGSINLRSVKVYPINGR